MRPGEDRQQLGEAVFARWFPGGSGLVGGVAVGVERATFVQRLGLGDPGPGLQWQLPVDDPAGSGRRLLFVGRVGGTRVSGLTARLLSRDRMDIDAAWRFLKDHLDRAWGAPSRQTGGTLVFQWTQPAAPPDRPFLTHIRGSRYQNDAKDHVLEVVMEVDPGVRLP